jgi:hypothetical protein
MSVAVLLAAAALGVALATNFLTAPSGTAGSARGRGRGGLPTAADADASAPRSATHPFPTAADAQ